MDWPSLLGGALIGGVVSLAISYRFYVASSRDLNRQAKRLSEQSEDLYKLNNSLIHLLDAAGAIEVKEYDPETGAPVRWSVSKKLQMLWETKANPQEEQDER